MTEWDFTAMRKAFDEHAWQGDPCPHIMSKEQHQRLLDFINAEHGGEEE